MTDDQAVTRAILTLGVTKTRDLSAREREAIDLARDILTERLGEHHD